MKLMFISDIHGSYSCLKKVIDIFEEEKPDKLIILGDILYHGPRNPLPEGHNPKEVVKLLNQYKDKIIAVRGNCDAEVDQMVLEFNIMETYTQLFVDNRCFFLTHGHHFDKEHLPKLNQGDVLIYGHYHVPMLEEVNGIHIVNPSSISLPKQGEKSYCIYENNEFIIYSLEKKPLFRKKM
jgi:hypothetical protein